MPRKVFGSGSNLFFLDTRIFVLNTFHMKIAIHIGKSRLPLALEMGLKFSFGTKGVDSILKRVKMQNVHRETDSGVCGKELL